MNSIIRILAFSALSFGPCVHRASAQVKLSWKNNNPTQTAVTVERATSASGPFMSVASLGGKVSTYIDNNVAGGKTYYYRVKANNSRWTSKYTNMASKALAAPVAGSGAGLKGQYYNGNSFGTLIKTQTDPQVNFNWNTGSPAPSIGNDNFSIRWSGTLLSQEGGTYVFSTETDDGTRLWINGTLVIDKWTTLGTFYAPVTLSSNTKYSLKMEYKELTGTAYARLKWTKPGSAIAALVPKSQLFPG